MIEIIDPDRYETVTDEMAAEALQCSVGVIGVLVEYGVLKTNSDGEIYAREIYE